MESSQKPETLSTSFRTIEDDTIMNCNSPRNENEACSPKRSKISLTTSKETTYLETEGDNNEKTGTAKIILLHPNSSFSCEESVFSIDHILEAIFVELDRSNLLNIRLVSRRWAIFGAKALQRIVTIRLAQRDPLFLPKTIKPKHSRVYCAYFDQNLSIEDLMAVMNNSAEFPSVSFSFLNSHDITVNETIQPFLNSYGASIKKLRFDGDLHLDDVRRLLLTQAPNLQTLLLIRIRIILFDEATSDDVKLDPEERADVAVDLFNDNEAPGTASKPKQILKNLKVFKCPSIIPNEFLSQLLEVSPNLVEVFLPAQNLPCLVRPVNRLHLVKKLSISIDENNIYPLEFVANPQNHQFQWKVEQFFYCRHNVYDDEDEDYYERLVGIMSEITAGVASSCRKLVWTTFRKDFKFPKMPHVKQLIVTYNQSDSPLPLLREDESLAEKFPSLESLDIRTCLHFYNSQDPIKMDEILGGFNDRQPVVDSTVRYVTLDFQPCEDFVECCRNKFPNALILTDFGNVESDDDEDSFSFFR